MTNAVADLRPCTTCGSPVTAGAPFCTVCGASAAVAPSAVQRGVPATAVAAQPIASRPPARPAFVPAPIGRRFGAYVTDVIWSGLLSGVLAFVISLLLLLSARSEQLQTTLTVVRWLPSLLGLAIGLILVGFVARGGTPGMRLVGLRVVRFDDAEPAGFAKALGRQVVLVLSGFIIVGPFSPLFDRTGANRGWHDIASGTWVVLKDPVPAAVAPPEVAAPPTVRNAPTEEPADSDQPPVPRPAYTPAAEPPVARVTVPKSTVAPPSSAPARGVAEPAPAPAPGGLVTGIPGSWAAQAATAPPAPADDDHTMLRPRPSSPRLRFATGDETLGTSALVGRDPAPRAGESVDRLITPPDAVRSMSKTHARIDVASDGIWITDRGSTNGTRLAGPAGWTPLQPNVRTPLAEGAEIEFGSVRATVVR